MAEEVKFTISPEGVAGLFLARVKASATIDDRDDLVELFKMFYDKGREDALSSSKGVRPTEE